MQVTIFCTTARYESLQSVKDYWDADLLWSQRPHWVYLDFLSPPNGRVQLYPLQSNRGFIAATVKTDKKECWEESDIKLLYSRTNLQVQVQVQYLTTHSESELWVSSTPLTGGAIGSVVTMVTPLRCSRGDRGGRGSTGGRGGDLMMTPFPPVTGRRPLLVGEGGTGVREEMVGEGL